MYGCMVYPIGVVQMRNCAMPNRKLCNYTAEGREQLNIQTGVPEWMLAWLARHSPPDMPIEMADNRLSAYSAQRGCCTLLHEPVPVDHLVTICLDPARKKQPNRYRNILVLSSIAGLLITLPDTDQVLQTVHMMKLKKSTIRTLNRYRTKRGLATI